MDDVKVFSSVDKVVSMVSLDTGLSNTWLAPLLINIRAQVSEFAAVKRGTFLNPTRLQTVASPKFPSQILLYHLPFPSGYVGQQKRSLKSRSSRFGKRQNVLQTFDVKDSGCRVHQTRQSLVCKLRTAVPVDYVAASLKRRVESIIAIALSCRDALSSRDWFRGVLLLQTQIRPLIPKLTLFFKTGSG